MTQPVFRFAPSPNGFLHAGHALSALLNADAAKQFDGRLLLRIEDIDTGRARKEFTEAIHEDLAWLGLNWEKPVRVQSQHFQDFVETANKLDQMGLLYPCFCSRKEIICRSSEHDPDGAPVYAGTCRNLSKSEIEKRQQDQQTFAMRLYMAKAMAALNGPLGYKSFDLQTLQTSEHILDPSVWGDIVIQRKDVPTSYHLAVVHDDAAQGITHVIRGKDLEASTAIHRLLQELLGLPQPHYFHHRLILDDEGDKQAKSKGALSLRDLRTKGLSPADIRKQVGL